MTLIAFAALVTFLYYIGARAEVTRFAWERYPDRLDKLARCPACSGFWIGLAVGARWDFPSWTMHGPDILPYWVTAMLWGGVWGLLLTPVGMWILKRALEATSVGDFDDPAA